MSAGLVQPALLPIAAKTASYQISNLDLGKVFTTRGHASGTITFTLPPVADVQAGWHCRFFGVGAGPFKVASAAADGVIAFNDVDADAIGFLTSSEIVGSGIEMVFDGMSWLAFVSLGAESVTPTVTS